MAKTRLFGPFGAPLVLGISHKGELFQSMYDNLEGRMVKVVLPNVSHAFARVWEYPDNSTVRSGADFEAAKYLASALNFDLQ